MTFYCPECVVNWYPYQCAEGCCPECGKGTKSKPSEAGSIDADARYKAAQNAGREREESERKHREFALYCAKRDAEADVRGLREN